MKNFTVVVSGTPQSGAVGIPVVHKVRASTIRKAVESVLAHIRDSGEHQRLEPHLRIGYISIKVCLTRLDMWNLPAEDLTGGYVKNVGRKRRRRKRQTEGSAPTESSRDRIQARMAALRGGA